MNSKSMGGNREDRPENAQESTSLSFLACHEYKEMKSRYLEQTSHLTRQFDRWYQCWPVIWKGDDVAKKGFKCHGKVCENISSTATCCGRSRAYSKYRHSSSLARTFHKVLAHPSFYLHIMGTPQGLTKLDCVVDTSNKSFISPLANSVATTIHLQPCRTKMSASPSQQLVSKDRAELR